jgi:prepilin-type N-terminal cleavage/methylation domain-containing protein
MKGFSLLELLCVMSIMAIFAMLAAPSFIHHNNLMTLQSCVNNLRWGLQRVPVQPVDSSWHLAGNTYSKAIVRPAGVLTVISPITAGGAWSCTFSDTSYNQLRC